LIWQFATLVKTSRIPAILFGILLAGYVVFLACTVSALPQQMATHFDASGHPNGWMSRSSAVIFQGAVGLILPLLIAVGFFTIRFVPTQRINVPRRDFWFAPERRGETCRYLSQQGFLLASLLVMLQGIVWYQLIESNAKSIPQLSASGFLVALGILAVAMIAWVISFFRHFTKAA
jgi:uncharacterized membrane protein